MSGNGGPGNSEPEDDLAALAGLAPHDSAETRAALIRAACHARLRRGDTRSPKGGRWPRLAWRSVEPAIASGLCALYLLAAFQRAVLLLTH